MHILVEEWNGFVFKMIEPSDYEYVLKHLRENFYHDEPLCQLMGYSKETTESFDRNVLEHLPHHLSFCAIHKESHKDPCYRNTLQIFFPQGYGLSLRIMYESTQDEYSSSPTWFKNKHTHKPDNIVHQFLTELEDKCNIFKMYGIPRCAQLHLTSVAREFRSNGLATEMYKRAIDFLKRNDFPMMKGCFSNDHTRHIACKLGFQELTRLYMKDFKNDEGVILFPNAENGQFVALMALKL